MKPGTKIDIFNHFLPAAYFERLRQAVPENPALRAFARLPALWDEQARLALLARHPDLQQILSLANPPVELVAGPADSPALVRLGNDGLARLCRANPDRFPGFIASLPMNNPEAAVGEARRAVEELGACGVQLYTNVAGTPLSAPQFRPVFAAMAGYDLPVWVHPMRGPDFADYRSEAASCDEIWFTFGWPYETSACMARLIFSGLLDELPGLKIITHHMGGMIPYFADKIGLGFEQIFFGAPDRNPLAARAGLKKQPLDYFRMLLGDTALNGSAAATRCGHAFFGTAQSLFATDAPFDSLGGQQLIAGTIAAVEALEIPAAERDAIFAGNASRLLRLTG